MHLIVHIGQNDKMNYQNIKLLIESQFLQPNNIVAYGQYFVAFLITFIYMYTYSINLRSPHATTLIWRPILVFFFC